MPNLKEMLKQAKKEEATKPKKIIKGIRPDKILRGEINFASPDFNPTKIHEFLNVEISQPERSHKPGQNDGVTVAERSHKPGQNVAIENAVFIDSVGNPTLLVGTQKKVFEYLFHLTQRYASLKTPKLTLEFMSASTGLTEGQIHSATKHLRKKNCLKIADRKDGRGGWVEYSIPQAVFDTWLKLENANKRSQNDGVTVAERSHKPGHKPGHEPPSSSSVLNISNKTTTQLVSENLEWLGTVNFDQVQSVGITKSVLQRCFDLYPTLTPENLEDLLFRFSEFIKEPKNRVQNARGFFIGLAKQLSEGITPLDHIETANDRLMREYTEKLREKKERQEKLDREAMEFEFETWLETLEPSKQIELIPENRFLKQGSAPHRAALKQYFSEKIWPMKKQQILETLITAHEVIVFQDSEKN